MKERLNILLIKSFDDNLSQTEQDELNKGLIDYPELLKEKEELILIRKKLQSQTYGFQYGFSNKVMRRIDELQQSSQNIQLFFINQLSNLFRKWVAPIGAMSIALIVISLYFTDGFSSLKTVIGINEITIDDAMTLSAFNYK